MSHPLSQFIFCPKCGAATFVVNNEKSKRCTSCGFVYYFNPSSAVACFIKNRQGELLCVRRAKEPAKGTLDLPGGFVDMYESAEEAARREVKEETGYTLTSYQYRGLVTFVFADIEMEYMSLFTGYSEYQTQNMSFDIVPSADRESQMYVAFRISDTAGPVPADNLSGRPVVMEIVPQEIVVHKEEPVEAKPKKKSKEVVQTVSYLVPSVCTVKIKDGANLLIQSRIPVYQLGVQGSMPIDANLL